MVRDQFVPLVLGIWYQGANALALGKGNQFGGERAIQPVLDGREPVAHKRAAFLAVGDHGLRGFA